MNIVLFYIADIIYHEFIIINLSLLYFRNQGGLGCILCFESLKVGSFHLEFLEENPSSFLQFVIRIHSYVC